MTLSIVRRNLLEKPGYTPYCGADNCSLRMPRTHFSKDQFECNCGWRSNFDAGFIKEYKQHLSDRQSTALYNETMQTP